MVENKLKQLHLIRIFLVFPIPLYVFLATRAPKHAPPQPIFYKAMLVLALVETVAALFIRSKLTSMTEDAWRKSPESKEALRWWFSSNIIPWALCLAVALYGFVLRYVGASLREVSPFFVAGFLLMLCLPPKAPVEVR